MVPWRLIQNLPRAATMDLITPLEEEITGAQTKERRTDFIREGLCPRPIICPVKKEIFSSGGQRRLEKRRFLPNRLTGT